MSTNQKLNQVIAVEKGVKTRTHDAITALHRASKDVSTFFGLNREYIPKDEGGQQLSPESKLVERKATSLLASAIESWADYNNVLLTKEKGNCVAKASIVVDGKVLLPSVPVSFLVNFEKQLDDMYKFVDSLPELPTTEVWNYDSNLGLWIDEGTNQHRSIRRKNFVVVPNSGVPEKGVAPQVREVENDEVVGTWSIQKMSGAMSPTQKANLLSKIDKVRRAVKVAREEANSIEVETQTVFNDLLKNLFEG